MSGPHEAIHGLILAGGGAVRLGGRDKALLRVGSQTILTRITARLAPQCSGLVLNANGDPSRFAAAGLPVVPDHEEDRDAGPLAGLLAGLDWTAAHRPEARLVLSAPADTPFLPRDLAARLLAGRTERDSVAACARSGDRTHPLAGLWPIELRHDLRGALRSQGLRRVGDFVSSLDVAWVEWPAGPPDPFFNVNTPADLVEAGRLAGLLD
jgi:molybdopterin-guanine dinucleotide biosynthesis protein A